MFCKFCKTGGILMTILYNRVGAKDRESMLQEKRCIRYGRQRHFKYKDHASCAAEKHPSTNHLPQFNGGTAAA